MVASKARQLAGELNKFLGSNAVVMGSDSRFKVKYLSTGLLPIDILFGGGLPQGRYVELTGAYSTLKSYIGLSAIAQTQKIGGVCAIIDTEHAYDPDWAESVGVDTDNLIVWPNLDDPEPHTGEEAVDVAESLIRNRIDLLVFDSIAATLPQAEAEKRLHRETRQMARQAALMSVAFRKLTAANAATAVLFINQMRDQVGVTFGPTERAPGGRAAGFYASMRANIRPAGRITEDSKTFTGDKYQSTKVTTGQTYRAVIEKSKLSKPWREIFFDWRLDTNELDLAKFLFTQGVDLGVVQNTGRTWRWGSLSVVGKDNFLKRLRSDQELKDGLENMIRTEHGLPPLPGRHAAASRKAVALKGRSSARKASAPTRGQARAVSASTAATKKRLQK